MEFLFFNGDYLFADLFSIFLLENLPRRWVVRIQKRDGKPYFYDKINNISQFERPSEGVKGKLFHGIYRNTSIMTAGIVIQYK